MPWYKKTFDCQPCDQIPTSFTCISIDFFRNFYEFKEHIKHILEPEERRGWERVFPEIVKKYGNGGQISDEEFVSLYQEMYPTIAKALYFTWNFPLHIHLKRKEGEIGWQSRFIGVAPEGFVIICNDHAVVSLMFRSMSECNTPCDQFFYARTQEYNKAFRNDFPDKEKRQVKEQDQRICVEISWKQTFCKQDNNDCKEDETEFNEFYQTYQSTQGGSLTRKLDELLARYRRQ